MTEVVAGRADFSVQLFTTTLPLLREGKLVALAVSAHKRASVMPDMPTMIEAGLPSDAVHPFYSGFFVPAKTPRNIVEKLHRESAKALEAAAVKERFGTLGVEAMPMTLEQFATFFKQDVDASVAIAQAAKIQAQ